NGCLLRTALILLIGAVASIAGGCGATDRGGSGDGDDAAFTGGEEVDLAEGAAADLAGQKPPDLAGMRPADMALAPINGSVGPKGGKVNRLFFGLVGDARPSQCNEMFDY